MPPATYRVVLERMGRPLMLRSLFTKRDAKVASELEQAFYGSLVFQYVTLELLRVEVRWNVAPYEGVGRCARALYDDQASWEATGRSFDPARDACPALHVHRS